MFADIFQRIAFNNSNSTVDFQPDMAISPILGYNYYNATIPGFQFTFDLFSVVNGNTYSQDIRDAENGDVYANNQVVSGPITRTAVWQNGNASDYERVIRRF